MIPKMTLFHIAPALLVKPYTHGEMMSQTPISPVSQSCHIIKTSYLIIDVNVNVINKYEFQEKVIPNYYFFQTEKELSILEFDNRDF
jgi:hypothetical protein